jgi:hypothetical protein
LAGNGVLAQLDPTPVVKSFAARASPEQLLLVFVLSLFGFVVYDLSKSVRALAEAVAGIGDRP